VRELVQGRYTAGRHAIAWDTRQSRGLAGAGVYFVRLQASGETKTVRFAVLD
jgi:hypothetical protein